MLSLDDLVAPVGRERFLRDHYGRQPLHLPGAVRGREALLDWAKLNAALDVRGVWTAGTLKLVRNRDAIGHEHYCDAVQTPEGRRFVADPAKVQVFLGLGASLIADGIEAVVPPALATARALGAEFAADVRANAYASFGGIQAFGPHYDLHEVFAVHCEGEKAWRFYEERAEHPVAYPAGGEDEDAAREHFERTKGRLLREVVMRPGDVMYVPRGWYHDALASSEASLHITFSVTPHTGKLLLRLLEAQALADPAFGEWLPDGRQDSTGMAKRAEALGRKLAQMASDPALVRRMAEAQRALASSPSAFTLPKRPDTRLWRVQPQAATVARVAGRLTVQVRGRAPAALPEVEEALAWLLSRPMSSLEEVTARFPQYASEDLREATRQLEAAGVLTPAR